jgi:CRISPR system Cascade subunit CasA
MTEFNLIDQPWIPCIDSDGQRVEYGIRDTFLKAHTLREICDDSPLVTVAIHRLLLAILYRAHHAPRDFKAWKELYMRKSFDDKTVRNYLDTWSNRFDLISKVYPCTCTGHHASESPQHEAPFYPARKGSTGRV